jgi:hypothetical protein
MIGAAFELLLSKQILVHIDYWPLAPVLKHSLREVRTAAKAPYRYLKLGIISRNVMPANTPQKRNRLSTDRAERGTRAGLTRRGPEQTRTGQHRRADEGR